MAMSDEECAMHRAQLELRIKEWTESHIRDTVEKIDLQLAEIRGDQRTMLYFLLANLVLALITLGGVVVGRVVDFGVI